MQSNNTSSSSHDRIKILAMERHGQRRIYDDSGDPQPVDLNLDQRCHVCDRAGSPENPLVYCPLEDCGQILCARCLGLTKSLGKCLEIHRKDRQDQCPYCHGYFHQTRRSRLCLEYIKSKKDIMEEQSGGKMQMWTIKTNLDSVLYSGNLIDYTHQRLRFLQLEDTVPIDDLTQFRRILKATVKRARDISFFGAILANSFVLYRHQENLEQYPLDQNFFDHCFRMVCREFDNIAELQERLGALVVGNRIAEKTRRLLSMKIDLQVYYIETFARYDPPDDMDYEGLSRLLTQMAAQLATNTSTHIKENFTTIQTNR